VIDRGRPGASADGEGERRGAASWLQGAAGERKLGAELDKLRNEGFAVLHDRRIPGRRANIDHVVIGPAGIFVIDTKAYTGKIERRDDGWLFRRQARLYVGGRNRTRLVTAMARQVEAVRKALGSSPAGDPRVIPVVCFVDSRWGLLAPPLVFGDVRVLWPRALGKLLRNGGTLSVDRIAQIERRLAVALPAAN
jgi:hypothetical protein